MSDNLYQDEEDQEKVIETLRKIYFFIGKCTTEYQKIEDMLPQTFAAAAPLSQEASLSVFAVAKGLEDKLRLINAVLSDRVSDVQELWSVLRPSIKWAFDQRNRVAHATPTMYGRGIVIKERDGGGFAFAGYSEEMSEFRLDKGKSNRADSLGHSDLKEVCDRITDTWNQLLIFQFILRDESVPAHLAKLWEHRVVDSWPTK